MIQSPFFDVIKPGEMPEFGPNDCVGIPFIENGVPDVRPATIEEIKAILRKLNPIVQDGKIVFDIPRIVLFEDYEIIIKGVQQLGCDILELTGEELPVEGFSLRLVASTPDGFEL